MSNLQPPQNDQPLTSSAVATTVAKRRRLVLAMAILISILALVQWALLFASSYKSIYSWMVPPLETVAALATWFTFARLRPAGPTEG